MEKNNQKEEVDSNNELPDDEDGIDPQHESELWKIRELKRIKQDRKDRNKFDIFKKEVIRRRNLTNEQIQ